MRRIFPIFLFVSLVTVATAVTVTTTTESGYAQYYSSYSSYSPASSSWSYSSDSSSSTWSASESSNSSSWSYSSSSSSCSQTFVGADFQAKRLSHTMLAGKFTEPATICPGNHVETFVSSTFSSSSSPTTYSFPIGKWGAADVSTFTDNLEDPVTLIGRIHIKDSAGNDVPGSPILKSVTLSDLEAMNILSLVPGASSLTVTYTTSALRGSVHAKTDGYWNVDDIPDHIFPDTMYSGTYTFSPLTPWCTITVTVWMEYELNPGEWITTESVSETGVPNLTGF